MLLLGRKNLSFWLSSLFNLLLARASCHPHLWLFFFASLKLEFVLERNSVVRAVQKHVRMFPLSCLLLPPSLCFCCGWRRERKEEVCFSHPLGSSGCGQTLSFLPSILLFFFLSTTTNQHHVSQIEQQKKGLS